MADTKSWRFQQLAGDREEAFLVGYAAPFGRPRIKSIYEPGKELRESVVRYPGNSGAPTRHMFGTMQHDFELSGRWMDKALGAGVPAAFVRQWQKWVQDQVPIRISWGDFQSYRGWVKSITPKWESTTECVWTIKFLIDVDETESRTSTATAVALPIRLDIAANEAEAWLSEGIPAIKKNALDATLDAVHNTIALFNATAGELFDRIDDVVSTVNEAGAAAVAIARSIDSLEKATYQELQRIRAGFHQFKTAIIMMQDTVDSIDADRFTIDREAEDDLAWLGLKTSSDARTVRMLSTISSLELAADLSQRGAAKTTYVALPSDTWERISIALYGDANGADKLRQANGIKYGALPVAGRTYQVT